jgi:hyperosmotically inducible protein
MNNQKSNKWLVMAFLLAFGVAACNKAGGEGSAEKAGKKIDEAVEKADKKITEQTSKAERVFDDTEITTKVKAAIFAEPGLQSLHISVNTIKGVVTLAGAVDSSANSSKANSLASAVVGVTSVDNKLDVTPK